VKLLFAIKSLNVSGGGAERVLVDIANGMLARGHQVQVLTFDPPGESFYSLSRAIERLNIEVGQPGKPIPRSGFLKAMPRIRRTVKEAKPELVIAFMHSTYVPLTLALLGAGIPLLVSEHVDAVHYRSRPVQHALVWMADRLALAKTVPSAPIRDQHLAAFRRHLHVMPNSVNVAHFRDIPALLCMKQPLLVLSVGRLMAEKNHIELLRAFALLADRFTQWNLRIVGDGELRPELETEVIRLGLFGRVILPGVSRDVASEYADASFVALPSLYESFGLVAAEALASGRAVLAFDHCLGIAEMVRNGVNGLLVPATGDRVAHLAAGLEQLMSDPALRARLGAAGPRSVQRFALDGVLDTWESLFLSLASYSGTHV
jgi:glycosyltransferase involved in cell wall biosynthesis